MRAVKLSVLVVAVLVTDSACGMLAARTRFDGTWNVTANALAGSCGTYFGFRVNVINGRIVAPGVGGVSGRVTPAGAVSVTVRQTSGVLVGTGRLNASFGSGRWTARYATGRCYGYWQARRGF